MNYIEYGKGNRDVIMLLHGGGLSWWNYREAAELLQGNYHVVLPIIGGHAGSDRDFTSIEAGAAEIIEFIDREFDGHVLLIGGLSLGGQILLELLSQRKDICRYALIESALAMPSKWMAGMIKPALDCSFGLIQRKWFAKLQFRSLHMKDTLFEDYYRDTCAITKSNMTAFLQANSRYCLKDTLSNCCAAVQICVGEKEHSAMKKSAELIHQKLPGSHLDILPKLYHGEFSINHPKDFAEKLMSMI